MMTTQQTGAIYVNKEGKRVINENMDFVSIKNATKEQTDKMIYLIMDQEAWDKWSKLANDDVSPAGRFTFEEQEKWFNTPDGTPIFRRGDKLEEVATSAGIDGTALKATIDSWNKMVSAGNDSEFGRKQLFPLATDGKYYIIEQKLRFATTLGGVRVTEGFQVENTKGGVIEGLYAAGECVGGVHGNESMPTCMLSWAVTSGKLAGEAVAKDLK
jgi:fumarate reductase flavoprotein subunit